MKKTPLLFFLPFLGFLLLFNGAGLAKSFVGSPGPNPDAASNSIVIISVDKLDSMALFNTPLPALRQMLAMGTLGLMNTRAETGYTDSNSGFLTLGSGSRATIPKKANGAFRAADRLNDKAVPDYLNWSMGIQNLTPLSTKLMIPEIGWIQSQALLEDHPVKPGFLGAILRQNGWHTSLIGNSDSPLTPNRPGGLLLMDEAGLISEGNINPDINQSEPDFPYRFRFSIPRVLTELQQRLAPRKVILIEYGDFARLDSYRENMLPLQFKRRMQSVWFNFNQFISKINELKTVHQFTFVVVSPSISKEGVMQKNLLAPIIINGPGYTPGLLFSGTTNWPGVVANIDFLPTIVHMAHLSQDQAFAGRVMNTVPVSNPLAALKDLNLRLIAINQNQRSLLDWYLGMISLGWIVALLISFLYKNKDFIGKWLCTGVAVIPLSLIILPLLPMDYWSIPGFLTLTVLFTLGLVQIQSLNLRFFLLSGSIWAVLIVDQFLGWNLIRFSALGYSAMAGSRYYGLGNEFMGIFLAVSLILAHFTTEYRASRKWAPWLILIFSILVLILPKLGAKFGGVLAGSIGFSFYLIRLSGWNLKQRKFWTVLLGGGFILFLIGWWDSLRPLNLQTHIGRFFRLFFNRDFGQVSQIMLRKLLMNMKLTVNSPWVRIILLALGLGILHRVLTKSKIVSGPDILVWQAILLSSVVAYLVNDAGVLACATCLAYGFSFALIKQIERKQLENRSDSLGLEE